jgi:hypothetical protein
MTLETVIVDTPASCATSRMVVTGSVLLASPEVYGAEEPVP